MRTIETRLQLVKEKIRQGEKRQERRGICALCAANALLLMALMLAIGRCSGYGHTFQGIQLTGASLLGENAGGCVLIAVLAFCAGCAACLIHRSR